MKKKLQIALGMGLGAFLLWFLFKDTDWAKVWEAVRDASWYAVAGFLGLVGLTFVMRVQRWSYIVRTAKPVSFGHLFSATQIGFLGNFVLPGRVGEIIRAMVLSRLAALPFTKCFAFVALDRVTDLFGLMAVLLVSVTAFHPQEDIVLPKEIYASPLPADIIRSTALMTGGAIIAVVVFFVLLYLNQRVALRISDAVLGKVHPRFAERIHALFHHFAEGLHVFRSLTDMAKSVSISVAMWMIFVLSYSWLFAGFGLDVPWYTGFVCISLLSVAISLPGAPGFVGQFHVAVVGGLLISSPSADLDVAKAVAIVAHIGNLIPVVLVGVYCLYREKFGLLELRRESVSVESDLPVLDK